jgi:hypothetical protein
VLLSTSVFKEKELSCIDIFSLVAEVIYPLKLVNCIAGAWGITEAGRKQHQCFLGFLSNLKLPMLLCLKLLDSLGKR